MIPRSLANQIVVGTVPSSLRSEMIFIGVWRRLKQLISPMLRTGRGDVREKRYRRAVGRFGHGVFRDVGLDGFAKTCERGMKPESAKASGRSRSASTSHMRKSSRRRIGSGQST